MDELDLLGESLLKQHLPDRTALNQMKNEKLPLSVLQQKKKENDLAVSTPPLAEGYVIYILNMLRPKISCIGFRMESRYFVGAQEI